MIYLPSIIVILTLVIEVWRDVKQFKKIGEIDHQVGLTIRFIGVFIAWGVEAYFYSASLYIPVFAVGLYLIFFDSLIANFAMKKSWFYVGHTAWWDKQQWVIIESIQDIFKEGYSTQRARKIWYTLKALTGAGLIYYYFTPI